MTLIKKIIYISINFIKHIIGYDKPYIKKNWKTYRRWQHEQWEIKNGIKADYNKTYKL